MKKIILLTLSALLLLATSCTRNEENNSIDLTRGWKFKTGDDPSWSTPGFDDSSWGTLDPGKIWEAQGYKGYNGIAWYRCKVLIRTKLRNQSKPTDSLQILLGRIDDCDQVYLNGQLIGENTRAVAPGQQSQGDFTKAEGIWYTPRCYKLTVNDQRIQWDMENVLAVRVFDHGGDGGMFSKPFEISMTGLKDRLWFNFDSLPFQSGYDSVVTKTFFVENHSISEGLKGELLTEVVRCDNRAVILSETMVVELTPGAKATKSIVFRKPPVVPAMMKVRFTEAMTLKSVTASTEIPYILTPLPPLNPRINGAKVFGVRPYSPFQFQVAASGQRPMRYKATDLPEGISINTETGLITGMLKKRGESTVKLTVENDLGYDEGDLKIVVGDLVSLTPPLGWNSWNCWGLSVSDKKVRQSADAMKASGLMDHGWTYINIDDGWEDTHDKDGNILTNYKFPNMPALCRYVHSLGLKIGIYSSPGTRTCGGYEGSYGFEAKDAANYAAWGIDYLKYDWCSYSNIAPDPTAEQLKKPYKEMRHALRKTNRDIHYSLCQYGMGDVWTWGAEVDGNSWRTTGDITDTWESMSEIGFSQAKCAPFAAPGRWNDPDMLVVGWVGWGPALHYTRLTPSEQYTHITLWSLLASPLLIGCDLERLDPFTLNLLSNDEVLAINQDPLGKQATQVYKSDTYEIWIKDLENGDKAVGLFNKTEQPHYIPVPMRDLAISGKWTIRDLWTQQDLGKVRDHFEMKVRPHGARMVRLGNCEVAK